MHWLSLQAGVLARKQNATLLNGLQTKHPHFKQLRRNYEAFVDVHDCRMPQNARAHRRVPQRKGTVAC